MVETIKFSEMTAGGDINNDDKTPGLLGAGNVLFNNPWNFLPSGTTAQRPAPSSVINFRLRFNTDLQLYEYYDAIAAHWTQLQESAFTQGPFLIYTADSSIPDGQNLGALANGILKQSISLGVATLDIAVAATDYWAPGNALTRTQVPVAGNDVTNKTYVDALVAGSVTSAQGTANQVLVNGTSGSPQTGAIILTTPQDIAPGSTPEFVNMTLSGGSLFDSNGNTLIQFLPVASAVNYLRTFNNATGIAPGIQAVGTDTDVSFILAAQNAGIFDFQTDALTNQYSFKTGSGLQHQTFFNFPSTSNTRTVTWPDATGTVSFVGSTADSVQGTANQVLVNGTSGSPQTGALILTTPQDIATTSTPTFSYVISNNVTTPQYNYWINGTPTWQTAANTTNFFIRDQVNARNLLQINPTTQVVELPSGILSLISASDTNIRFFESGTQKYTIGYSISGDYLFIRDVVNSKDMVQFKDNSISDFIQPIGFPGNTRYGIAKTYNSATGDNFGIEQVSGAQSGYGVAALRLFTSNINNAVLSLGKYTNATTFQDWIFGNEFGMLEFPNQVTFFAYRTSATLPVTGDGFVYNVDFDQTAYNIGGGLTTGVLFTAPADGKYFFKVVLKATGFTAAQTEAFLFLDVSVGGSFLLDYANSSNFLTSGNGFLQGSAIVFLDEGDTVAVDFQVDGAGTLVAVDGDTPEYITYWQGIKVA